MLRRKSWGKPRKANGNSIPPPPPVPADVDLQYVVRSPWAWVMKHVSTLSSPGIRSIVEVDSPSSLASAKLAKPSEGLSTPGRKKGPLSCTLRVEVMNKSILQRVVHGTSQAFDGIEDKDELVRTIQRYRCEQLNLSPPSVLIQWDVTREICNNYVGERVPVLPGNPSDVAVLKEPMGSRGDGIFFVSSADEIYEIMDEHRKRALDEGPDFLDGIIASKGRIPAWVLQAEIYPPLLIQGGRKFHIRTYVVAVEKLDHDDLLDVYVYNRHEVRIASEPVNETEGSERDRIAHITNGAFSDKTERVLLHNVPELVERKMQQKVDLFVAQIFGKHFVRDLTRRVSFSASQDGDSLENIRKFAIAGLDIMAASDDRLYLLEANVNPAAPPEDTVEGEFKDHLVGFMSDLIALTLGRKIGAPSELFSGGANNFVVTDDILERNVMQP